MPLVGHVTSHKSVCVCVAGGGGELCVSEKHGFEKTLELKSELENILEISLRLISEK